MKKLYPILIILLIFALRSEKVEFNSKFISTYRDYDEFYRTELARLSEKHSSKLLFLNDSFLRSTSIFSFIDKKIIIDTVVVKSYMKDGEYFIATRNGSSNRFLCNLKCEKSLFNSISGGENRHYLIALKINSIKSGENIVEIDSIENKSLFVNAGRNFVVSGECLDAVGLPFESIFTLD